MEKTVTQETILKNQWIPGPLSRSILRNIVNNESIDPNILPSHISLDEVEHLRYLYLEKKEALAGANFPKYLPFYYLIEKKINNFKWEVSDCYVRRPLVSLTSPRADNLRLSLLTLLLKNINFDDPKINKKYRAIKNVNKAVIMAFDRLINVIQAIVPNQITISYIFDWIRMGIEGQEITLFIPICPDYAVESTDNPSCPLRHTFDGVGFGNGQIAKRILSVLPHMKKFFSTININPKVIVGIADFEAFSQENLKRVGLNKQEFIERVESSRQAFKEESELKEDIYMLSELFGGESSWHTCVSEIKKAFAQGDFGVSKISKKILLNIIDARKALYSRWYGKKESIEEYLPIVLNQGAEYAAMGWFLSRMYKNCLVLGADNNVMSSFYSYSKVIPALYLKRFYC